MHFCKRLVFWTWKCLHIKSLDCIFLLQFYFILFILTMYMTFVWIWIKKSWVFSFDFPLYFLSEMVQLTNLTLSSFQIKNIGWVLLVLMFSALFRKIENTVSCNCYILIHSCSHGFGFYLNPLSITYIIYTPHEGAINQLALLFGQENLSWSTALMWNKSNNTSYTNAVITLWQWLMPETFTQPE